MKPTPFEYVQARDVDGALALLAQADGFAKVLAGGQSLGPMLNLRLVRPDVLVDVRQCDELRAVETEADAVVFGAGITHAEIEDGRVPDPTPGWLRDAARKIAYRAIRNRGTLGGSLAHADPAADWLTVLLGLEAEVVVRRQGAVEALRLCDFVRGPFLTSLLPGDLLVAIRVPRPTEQARWGYQKVAVKAGEFAQAMCVAFYDPARDIGRIVIGALGRAPLVYQCEPSASPNSFLASLLSLPAAEAFVATHLGMPGAVSRRPHAVALRRAVAQVLTPQGPAD